MSCGVYRRWWVRVCAVLLALLSLVVAILTMRTVMAVVRGEIFQPG
jgi:uncharacterized protein YpmS